MGLFNIDGDKFTNDVLSIKDILERSIPLSEVLGRVVSFAIAPAVNKKVLLTLHPWVNPERLSRILGMNKAELLASYTGDPMTCWVIDYYTLGEKKSDRKIAVASGTHRAALFHLKYPAEFKITGAAVFNDEQLLERYGLFKPELTLYHFNVFLASIRSYLSTL